MKVLFFVSLMHNLITNFDLKINKQNMIIVIIIIIRKCIIWIDNKKSQLNHILIWHTVLEARWYI